MPRTTKGHPTLRPEYAAGNTCVIPAQRPPYQSPVRPPAIYPAYTSRLQEHIVGEDGWIGEAALTRFADYERNYAWIRFYAGDITRPSPEITQGAILRCLVLAKPYQLAREPLLLVSRGWPHLQLWVCKDRLGTVFMVTPEDYIKQYLPYMERRG